MQHLCDKMWACYILRSLKEDCNKTYVGSTNSTCRRIRQHNREIVGGAKASESMMPSEMYCIVTGFADHITTLRAEYLLKHPTGQRKKPAKFNGVAGRIYGLNNLIINSTKWKERSGDCNIKIWIKKEYAHLLEVDKFPETVEIYEYTKIETINSYIIIRYYKMSTSILTKILVT
jgi:predicted GIY-YIG superfamily endonuclease